MDYEFEIAGKLSESSIFLVTSESSWVKNAQYSWKSRKKDQEAYKNTKFNIFVFLYALYIINICTSVFVLVYVCVCFLLWV